VESKQLGLYLDLQLLQGYLDSLGKNVVEQMFSLYCQQVKIYLKDIEYAQKNNSVPDWQEHCHKLKGASASVGMIQLHKLMKELEHTEASQEQKFTMLTQLRLENQQASIAFQNWLAIK
jgi:HPt (histidine-containing phosphotransfer) domain-containing protein